MKRPKIVFIGAGSLGFTRNLVRDVLTFPLLQNAEIALVDINKERLNFSRKACEKIIAMGDYPAVVTTTTERREALKGADAVMVTILCGAVNVWKHDILIPKKYGVDINVGDTRGPSGIFRALRTIPTMLEICWDMEDLCPDAVMLNHTNPMAMVCQAMQKASSINVTGLCHSVQGTVRDISTWLDIDENKVDYVCAGINHLAWYLKLEYRGKDLYPRLRKAITTDKKVYNEEQVRNEMFLALGHYVTESSGHNSEYNWWFRKSPALIREYCTNGTGWNPGKHAYLVKSYENAARNWKKEARAWLDDEAPISLERGPEYAAAIINAYLGGELFEFNGNVLNTGLITNLPEDCCVEVPVLASKKQLAPIYVGELPPQLAMLTGLNAQIETMAVDGCLTGNAELVYQAIAHDPLTASKLSLAEIRKMVKEMFRKNAKYLPHFRNVDI